MIPLLLWWILSTFECGCHTDLTLGHVTHISLVNHADLVEDELDVLWCSGTALDVGVEHRVLLAELVNIIVVNVANIIFTANKHALEVLVGLLYLWHPRLHDVDHRLPRVQREAENEDFHVGVVRLSDRF